MSDILQELMVLAGIPLMEAEETAALPNENSLGKRIAPRNNQTVLKNFWNWFADSKIKDAQGRPLVLYHGTDYSFTQFEMTGEVDFPSAAYFTSKMTLAKTYGSNVMPVYLRMGKPYVINAEGRTFNDFYEQMAEDMHYAKDNGFDGVIIRNLRDDWGQNNKRGLLADTYAVFDSRQIKSIENGGFYDENSKNIYEEVEMNDIEEAVAYAGSRRDYDNPSLDAIGSGEGTQAHGWGLYYALNPDIAETYRKTFTESPYENVWELLGEDLTEFLGDLLNNETRYMLETVFDKEQTPDTSSARSNLLIALYDVYQFYATRYRNQHNQRDKELAEEAMEKRHYVATLRPVDFSVGVGVVHKVEIPDLKFLMGEKEMMCEQSDYVRLRIASIVKDVMPDLKSDYFTISGKEFYNILSDKLGSPKKASFLLHKYGIKGIHYFGEQDGECVVIFNPEDLRVLKKFYGGNGIEMEQIGG